MQGSLDRVGRAWFASLSSQKLPMIIFGAAEQYIPFCPAPPPVKIPPAKE
nr:MAG TPA: hypothetical protein [Caudoviricetes sp.]